MASVIRSGQAKELMESSSQETMASEVQSYLITSYRDALKKGDKSAAKSCLLAARYFSVNDPNVTNEIYNMAKSDGDVGEASKCFANIFNDLFVLNPPTSDGDSPKTQSSELLAVINQIKEETRLLLNELKSQYLKLKSAPAPTTSNPTRQIPSVNQSPLLSPRMRMSSEDRAASRESVSKLDTHLHSSTRAFFYQQLFNNLPDDVKKSILEHSIETSDNPYEKCRLIMLTLKIFNETAPTYASRLLTTLMEMSELSQKDETSKHSVLNPRPPIMCRYAKSLLVLDAIPLVLNICSLSSIDVDIDDLFQKALNFCSEICLEAAASEYEFDELHDGLVKYIAARILGIESGSSQEDVVEEHLSQSLDLLAEKFIETVADSEAKAKYGKLRAIIADKSTSGPKFHQLIEIVRSLDLESDIPDDILYKLKEDSAGSQTSVTPPPKGRGRPKKVQSSVIVSLDDGVKKHLKSKSRESHFVFLSLMQHLFYNCANYLKQTKTRILMNFSNPLAASIETELAKSSQPRSSRSKASNMSSEPVASPSKKLKIEAELIEERITEDSPLKSEESRMIDRNILTNLIEANKIIEFFNSNHGAFTKLWNRFLNANNANELSWFRRIRADCLMVSGQYQEAGSFLGIIFEEPADNSDVKVELSQSGTSTLTVATNLPPISVAYLRGLVQYISCLIGQSNKQSTLEQVDELLSKLKQCGLFKEDASYSSGDTMDEYMVIVDHDGCVNNLGFLFFDTLSITRYVADVLMDIFKKYVASHRICDTVVGHTIVLSQFDWPKESPIYHQCLIWLRANKPKSTTPQCLSVDTKFTYPEFFHFVKNPNIIEDFMALLCQGYTLDIKSSDSLSFLASSNGSLRSGSSSQTSTTGSRGPGSSATRSGKAITTRGVNKSFKEDLKVALVAQMRNSSTLIPLDMISEFIQVSLLPYLSNSRK